MRPVATSQPTSRPAQPRQPPRAVDGPGPGHGRRWMLSHTHTLARTHTHYTHAHTHKHAWIRNQQRRDGAQQHRPEPAVCRQTSVSERARTTNRTTHTRVLSRTRYTRASDRGRARACRFSPRFLPNFRTGFDVAKSARSPRRR